MQPIVVAKSEAAQQSPAGKPLPLAPQEIAASLRF